MIWYLGISPPDFGTVRAFTMVVVRFFLFGLLVQRKGYWLNTLLTAVLIIVIWRPDAMTDLSFQLSVAAVLCIGFAAGGKQENKRSSLVSYIRSSLLITVAANAGTAPLLIYYFHKFSLVSPLTNLIIVPAIGFVVLPLAFLSSVIFLLFNVFPFHSVLDAVRGGVLSLIDYAGRWDFAAVAVPSFPPALIVFFYAGLCIFAAMIHSRRSDVPLPLSMIFPFSVALVPIVIFSAFALSGRDRLAVTFLDVGQGDGAVIELPDHRAMVMDTGNSGFQVGEFLRYRVLMRSRRLCCLMVTMITPAASNIC